MKIPIDTERYEGHFSLNSQGHITLSLFEKYTNRPRDFHFTLRDVQKAIERGCIVDGNEIFQLTEELISALQVLTTIKVLS